MSDQLQEIRALAREFAAAELRPHTETWDRDRAFSDDILAKLAELGFFGMLVPEADGGMELDAASYAVALEELAWGEAGVAVLVAYSAQAADLIARYGSEELKQNWLTGLAAGTQQGCIAFAEEPQPGGGAVTRAEPQGDGWSVRGSKRWVTNGDRADVGVVLAATGDGTGLFAVPAAGMRAGERAATLGLRTVAIVDVEVDATVDGTQVLAGFDEGRAGGDWLGRLSTAAIAVGVAQAALEHAVRYADEREQFGRPIRAFEGIQHKLADMATRTAAARAMVARAATMPHDTAASAMAKLFATECAMFVTTEAVQVFGGYGYMRDYPVEKLMRDAKALEIMHGPSDDQRLRIARSLYE